MPRSFNLRLPANAAKDARVVARLVLGVLLLATLAAAYAAFFPVGGSAEELDAEIAVLRNQILQRQAVLQRTRAIAAKIEKARGSGDQFMASFFLDRRSAFSSIVSELNRNAKDAGIKPRGEAFVVDPIEGSDNLSMMTITANYEGTYRDLLEFVNRLDKSPRFLILDTLTAAPQQGTGALMVAIKLNAFVREDLPQL